MTRQLAEREDTSIQYVKERKQNEQILAALRQDKDMLNERSAKLNEKSAAQAAMLAQLEAKNTMLQESSVRPL